MAERQVTVEGKTWPLATPFQVLATMNPLDHDGTYALPAAQLDRFTLQLSMGFPGTDAEIAMLDTHLGVRSAVEDLEPVLDQATFVAWQETVPLVYAADAVKRYAVALVQAIRQDARALAPPSPRATLMLVRVAQAHALAAGRDFLTPTDLQACFADVLAHRIILSGDQTAPTYLEGVLRQVRVPG
jgi:MoxR-like ATPase